MKDRLANKPKLYRTKGRKETSRQTYSIQMRKEAGTSAHNHTETKEGRQQTQRSKADMQLCGQRVVNRL